MGDVHIATYIIDAVLALIQVVVAGSIVCGVVVVVNVLLVYGKGCPQIPITSFDE